jgi:hypothetical protein
MILVGLALCKYSFEALESLLATLLPMPEDSPFSEQSLVPLAQFSSTTSAMITDI